FRRRHARESRTPAGMTLFSLRSARRASGLKPTRMRRIAVMHELREAVPEDAPALQRLYADIRGSAEWLPPAARRNADFARDSAGERVIVAVAPDGSIDGLISVWEPQAFVHHLYVRESARRRGLARALLEFLLIRMPRIW